MSRTIQRPSEAGAIAAAAPAEDVPYPLAKRVFDRTVAALLLLVLSPLLLLALAILAVDMVFVPRDRGRWLYRELRISRGREFEVLKFRVLREEVLAEIASRDDAYARLYEADHVNLTGAGRIIKRIYADELPQIFNVLRGDISLVGPRPWPVAMVETQVAKGFDYRLHVTAGWTGPAQVRKDSKAKSRATDLDLEYVDLCRTLPGAKLVRHDLRVLGQSLRTVLRGRGLRY
ncbi:MAG TPA: sugar transferase [Gaiellaceae bacterium]|jgi:lipopolysaccharide/colanic/teichoic acid biosynthesis glycosyltransferase